MEIFAVRHKPAAPLDAFVEAIWFYESEPRPFSKERLMPGGGATLIFNLLEDEVRSYDTDDLSLKQRLRGSALTGPQSQSFVIDTAEQIKVMGVEFHPGGSWPFFEPAADEICNQHVELKDLWGDGAESLRARLLAAPTVRAKISLLEEALLQRAARPMTRDVAINHAVQSLMFAPHIDTIATLTQRMSISARAFSRRFTEQVGLKPKTFARVQRFQRVLAQIGLGRNVDWASVVAQCGYYDQAHFIHDFRAFSGFTPTEYADKEKVHIQHVPLD